MGIEIVKSYVQAWSYKAFLFCVLVQNFVLEEFEDLVDELLLKINAISSSDEDQDNYEEQNPLQPAYDNSSEVDITTV